MILFLLLHFLGMLLVDLFCYFIAFTQSALKINNQFCNFMLSDVTPCGVPLVYPNPPTQHPIPPTQSQ